jgi:anti-sigma factor RsiW
MSMHPDLPEPTILEASRYVDGQLTKAECLAFELRMQRDPQLLLAVEAVRALRVPFAAAAAVPPPPAPAGFSKRVLQAVRRLPVADETGPGATLEPSEVGVVQLVRRSLLAAALIFGLGLLMFAGLLRRADSSRLEAAPGTHKKLLDDLDQKIKARLEKPGPEKR